MQVVNFTEARNNLKALFDSVFHDSQEVIVNRKNGENVVILSLVKSHSHHFPKRLHVCLLHG